MFAMGEIRCNNLFPPLSVHVVFGHVIQGEDVVNIIANTQVDKNDKPQALLTIANCGELIPQLKSTKTKTKKDSTKKNKDNSDDSSSSSSEDEGNNSSSSSSSSSDNEEESCEEGEIKSVSGDNNHSSQPPVIDLP